MKVVIAGAAGLIGRHAAAELAANGHEIVCVDRLDMASNRWQAVVADLADAKGLEKIFAGADAVLNLARVRFPYTASGYDSAARTWLTMLCLSGSSLSGSKPPVSTRM